MLSRSGGSIEALVDTTGTLNPVTIVDIGSQVSGKIKEIYVDFNSKVKAGQVIAQIDSAFFETQVNQSKANYSSSQASLEKSKVNLKNVEQKYKRSLELFGKNLISEEEMETAEAQYYNAKSDLQSAQAGLEQSKSRLESSQVDLSYTVIKSPIDGVVISRNINVGQTVAASFQAPVLFKIANSLSKMRVECSIDEADIGKVKEGQKARFTVDAYPEYGFSGLVKQVRYASQVVQNVVTYITIVEVDNLELKLLPGMTANISIIINEAKDVLLVPNTALRFTPPLSNEELQAFQAQRPTSTGRVWIEKLAGKLEIIVIRIGITDNNKTEVKEVIRGELKEGTEVIVKATTSKGEEIQGPRTNMMMQMQRMLR